VEASGRGKSSFAKKQFKATDIQPFARKNIIEIAQSRDVFAVAIVFDMQENYTLIEIV
jgi:predicted kinase